MNMRPRSKIFLLVLAAAALLPVLALADTANVNGNGGNTSLSFNLGIPGTHDVAKEGPAGLVANIYEFALLIGGLLAFGSIIYGAIMYMMNPGSSEAQSAARSRIYDALLGLLLLLGIYFLLNLIDPSLTKLRFPTLMRWEEVKVGAAGSYICTDAGGKETGCYTDSTCGGACEPDRCVQKECSNAVAGASYVCTNLKTKVSKKCYATKEECLKDTANCDTEEKVLDEYGNTIQADDCVASPTACGAPPQEKGLVSCQSYNQQYPGHNGCSPSPAVTAAVNCLTGTQISGKSIPESVVSAQAGGTHHANSCHFGGRTCADGGHAFDVGKNSSGSAGFTLSQIKAAAQACSSKISNTVLCRYESAGGKDINLAANDPRVDHIHCNVGKSVSASGIAECGCN